MLVGCASFIKQPAHDDVAARLADLEHERRWLTHDRHRLVAELEAAKRRNIELEHQLDLSRGSLTELEEDLLTVLQPEIANGTVTVNQIGGTLTINSASSLLFESGKDQLKADGTNTLRRVGGILKDFPETQVYVAVHTENVAILGALPKKFPSDRELSTARAMCVAQALWEAGVSSQLSTDGYGESNPVTRNHTAVGRAMNQRVEIVVS